jgi:hypothetical protein
MTDAPERIWAWGFPRDVCSIGEWQDLPCDHPEYIRADTVAAMVAEARIDAEAKLSESEDLLAKAQGALHQIAGKKDYADDPWGIARTTLAELKGQDDGQAPHAG